LSTDSQVKTLRHRKVKEDDKERNDLVLSFTDTDYLIIHWTSWNWTHEDGTASYTSKRTYPEITFCF